MAAQLLVGGSESAPLDEAGDELIRRVLPRREHEHDRRPSGSRRAPRPHSGGGGSGTAAWRPVATVRTPRFAWRCVAAPCERADIIGERKVKVQPLFSAPTPCMRYDADMEPTSFTH